MTNSINELAAADCILITGSNTTEQHPVIAGKILEAVRRGAAVIIFDPRRIQLSPYASMHLAQKPGTDVACINAMMKVVIDEGLFDREFVTSRTEGFEDLKQSLDGCTPEWASEITGVPAGDLAKAARTFAGARSASIVYCMGITQHTSGTDNVKALANLAMLTGNVGRPSTGVNPLRGQNNVQGACDVGGLPEFYPGYQRVDDEKAARKFERAWGRELPRGRGLTLMEMIEAASSGKVKFMYILGENPLVSDPNTNHVRAALENLDFLVVQDIMETDTAALADVVLPGACWAEKEGTFTNTERRVQRVRKAVEPPGEALADWEVLCRLAREMGAPGFDFVSPEEVFDEMATLAPQYAGISYGRLGTTGLQWPCPTTDHPGTVFLHEGEFTRGKGRFSPVEYRPPAEPADDEYPFTLMTGRITFQYHTGTMTRNSPSLDREVESAYIEVSPADADGLGVSDGGLVKVASRRGELVLEARLTDRVKPGEVFMPFHFAESPANVLTSDALDPVSRIPELKVCAVRIEGVGS
jgi:formate dehydrogenase alpha subunit